MKRLAHLLLVTLGVALSPWRATSAATPDAAAIAAFRERHGAAWSLSNDPGTGRPRRLFGGFEEWLPASRLDDPAADALLADRAAAFVRTEAAVLGVDPATLRPAAPAVVHAGALRVLHFDVAPQGVRVVGGRVTLVVSHGRLIGAHLLGTAPVVADPRSTVSESTALATALAAAQVDARATDAGQPELVFLPEGAGHRLAWEVTLRDVRQPHRQRARIDALTGGLISLTDETVAACDPAPPMGAERRVLGGVRSESALDAEQGELLPRTTVPPAQVGPDGFFGPPPLPYAATLSGPGISIDCVGCSNPAVPAAPAGTGGDADFGSGGLDAIGNGTSTPSDRAVYFHADQVRRYAARWLSIPFLGVPLTAHTNLPSACNAYWDGSDLNFFRASARCANTGEIRDVIQHEWGHGLDQNDGLAPPGLSVDGATGEAAADAVALLRSRDACIGEGFFIDPADGPSVPCSGVRDLDELAPGHEHGSPATLTTANVVAKCPPSAFYRGPLGREGHCESEILGQALYHLVQDLRTGRSYADGSALPDGPASDDEAWEIVERLFFTSRSVMASYAPSTLQSIGTSAYDAFLMADDEGDGVTNGTPHAAAIHDAFAHHGIAELPAAPPDTAGCMGPPAPTLNLSVTSDPASGLPALRLAWNDVGAAGTWLLRADDPDDAFVALAPRFGPGTGAFVDRAVLPGRTYRYRVQAEDAGGCFSAAAPAVVGSPGAILRVAAARIDDSGSPAPDGRLETGETADLLLDLANDGTGTATNLLVTVTSSDPGLVVVGGGPIAYGTLAGGASVTGPAPFRVRALTSAPPAVLLVVTGEATEGCLRTATVLPIAEPDLVLAGTDIDDTALGNGDRNWDPGETIDLFVLLRNAGTLDADPVSATLAFRGPPVMGVTIVRAAASWPPLIAGGAPTPSLAPTFQLAAQLALGPRTRVPLTLDVGIAGEHHRTIDLDLTVGRFLPGSLEWTYEKPRGTYVESITPLVLQLDDDDGDGVVTRCDVPDVIVQEDRGAAGGALLALRGDGGAVKWELVDACTTQGAFNGMAGGDIDGDGLNEIVVGDKDGYVCAISSDGTVKWRTTSPVHAGQSFSHHLAPQVWDLDGDGTVEVIAGHTCLHGTDGTVAWDFARNNSGRVVVHDLDLDGKAEVLAAPDGRYRADGSPYLPAFAGFESFHPSSLGNLDADPEPEIVTVTALGDVRAWNHDGSVLWVRTDMPGPRRAIGPTCMGDFDGDGLAEIGVQTIDQFHVLESDGSTKWSVPANDLTGSAGCSVFDFDGDGPPEILFRDHSNLTVWDGLTGEVLWQTPIISGTAFEYPVVADVDGDGSAEVLVLDGFTGGVVRVRCFGNPAWPPARSIWNQEDYSVTHVEEDGRIVSRPVPRWLGANDFRGQARACPCSGPVPDISWTRPDCTRFTLCFAASVAGGRAPHDLTWDFGDGSPSRDGDEACHDYPGLGDYPVRLRVVDANGCPAEWTRYVTVPEPLSVDFAAPSPCPDEDACFSALATGGVAPLALEWDFGDGSPHAFGPSPCHAFTAGANVVTLFASDATGCLAEVSHVVAVGGPPAAVGDVLYGTAHGDPYAASITGRFEWAGDLGAPRAAGESYDFRRGTSPIALTQVPGTAGLTTPWYVDATPRTPDASLPGVHYYLVFAVNACGVPSTN